MNMSISWILMCGAFIFFMQAGFTCYEVGFIRSKNIISVAIENLLTFMIVTVLYCIFGFGFMFGESFHGLIGTGFIGLSGLDAAGDAAYSYAFMQTMFAAASITIFGGAMSERSRLSALLAGAAVSAVVIYPVFGHWAWGSMVTGTSGWLEKLGFMDFAGASVVHLTGGFIALAGIITAGRRKDTGPARSNIPFAVLGVFILWFGWLGFNGGSLTELSSRAGLMVLNMTLGAACGMAGALAYHIIAGKKGNYLVFIFDGILGGLVAATACSYYCSPAGAAALTFITGVFVAAVHYLLIRLVIDDAVDAVPVHAAGAVSGLLLMPLFMEQQFIEAGSRIEQLGIQCLGILVNFIWAFGIAYIMFRIIDRAGGIRVSPEAEEKGLNITELEDIYSWEKYMEKSGYETQINEKNRLLRKQARLLAVTEEQEKDKIRRELHDGVGQSLAALKVTLGIARGRQHNEEIIDNAIHMADETIQEMRAVLNSLNPPRLEQGLESALRAMAEGINRIEGVTCRVFAAGDMPAFEDTAALNIYRVVQEACSNAVKHGNASDIDIDIKYEGSRCIFEIKDNGKGFHVSDKQFGMGIPSMGDRIRMLGGKFTIYSTVGEGTRVVAEVPCDEQKNQNIPCR